MMDRAVEEGKYISGFKKRRKRVRCACLLLLLAFLMLVASCIISELYRHEAKNTFNHIMKTMTERESVCLSSIHVGRPDYFMVLIAPTDKTQLVAMLNPIVYQKFGAEVKTQEIANPPTQCYTTRKKAYTIHRERRESVSISYTAVNVTDLLWPAKSLYSRSMKTFTGTTSFCLQHVIEMSQLQNACDELVDNDVRYERRFEL